MTKLSKLSVQELQRAIAIKQQIDTLIQELESLENGDGRHQRGPGVIDGRIEALKRARQARWAKHKAAISAADSDSPSIVVKRRKKRTISPEHKAKLAAAIKARWAKVKAEGKAGL